MAVERLTQLQLDGFAKAVHDLDPEEISAAARTAFETLIGAADDKAEGYEWYQQYKRLARHRVPWRVAVYVAWASVPKAKRVPKTQEALARDVLGLTSDRVLISLRQKYPEIDLLIAQLQSNELFEHRAEIFEALIESASSPNYKSHQDRKIALEMMGDYNQRIQVDDRRDPTNKDLKHVPESELRKWADDVQDDDPLDESDLEDDGE
jgi:hypothetical protein